MASKVLSPAVQAAAYVNYSSDWWTPPEWMQWVRATLGPRAFDPAPKNWKPGSKSGLGKPWRFPCYLNHPGSRGSAVRWWEKSMHEGAATKPFIWCAFAIEQLRHMDPSPFELSGWLVMPETRIGFIWGGKTMTPDRGARRVHGERNRQPANWTVFWSTRKPATPPVASIIVPTGKIL